MYIVLLIDHCYNGFNLINKFSISSSPFSHNYLPPRLMDEGWGQGLT